MNNIKTLFNMASDTERKRGLFWYQDARDHLRAMAAHHKVELKVVAGVVSALSPLQNWESNVLMANAVLGGKRVKGLGRNIAKAKNIKKTSKVMPHLQGPKVRAFFFNLMGNESELTIDTLMISAYLNKIHKTTLTKGQRIDLEKQVDEISKSSGLTRAQVQAVVWVVWHRVARSNFPGSVSLLKIF